MLHNRVRPLRVEVTWDDSVATVCVRGELDITTAPNLAERLLEVAAARPQRLVLDLHDVAFIDLSGARAIASVREALRDECPVILRRPRPSARKALGVIGLLRES